MRNQGNNWGIQQQKLQRRPNIRELCSQAIVVEDLNFDGKLDFSIMDYPAQHDSYTYWTWDNTLGNFTFDEDLNALRLIDAMFLQEEQAIYSRVRDSAMDYTEYTYRYIYGKPVLVEMIDHAWDMQTDMMRVETWELVGSELKITGVEEYAVQRED